MLLLLNPFCFVSTGVIQSSLSGIMSSGKFFPRRGVSTSCMVGSTFVFIGGGGGRLVFLPANFFVSVISITEFPSPQLLNLHHSNLAPPHLRYF